jgi:hypothetical protein
MWAHESWYFFSLENSSTANSVATMYHESLANPAILCSRIWKGLARGICAQSFIQHAAQVRIAMYCANINLNPQRTHQLQPYNIPSASCLTWAWLRYDILCIAVHLFSYTNSGSADCRYRRMFLGSTGGSHDGPLRLWRVRISNIIEVEKCRCVS